MTNFSAGRSQRSLAWFTPERAVVLLPILLGLGLASMVLILGFTPLSVLVRDRQTTVDQLKIKRDAVPNLRAELDKLLAEENARQNQQDQLLGLIAGTSELSTFLAELNQLVGCTMPIVLRSRVTRVQARDGRSPSHGRAPGRSHGHSDLNRPGEYRALPKAAARP